MRKHKKGSKRKSGPGQVSNRLTSMAFSLRTMESIDTPRSLAVYLMAKYGEHDQLADLAIDPLHYLAPADFYLDYQATKLLSKFPNLDVTFDPLRNALKKFIEAEASCMETNDRLMSDSTRLPSKQPTAVDSVFYRAQRKVSHLLGDVPNHSELQFRFGPGATFGVRRETSVFNKVTSVPECTFAMRPILDSLVRECPSWLGKDQDFIFREGSELAFVPKNAKTHRPICIEPTLNGFYQKGIGSYMRHRLNRFGVNLNDQGVNQKLASVAHEQDLCTIDFASASDTVSYMLVLNLLPFPWFEALDVARCAFFRFEGQWWPFHKFTSMGNAYTFELETLIFYSLACATCEYLGIKYETGVNLSVYGDDVIIPRAAYDLFSEVCSHYGFSINSEKSFTSGPFYESCGKDYFLGHLVRPFLLKKDIRKIEDAYYVTNCINEMVGRLEELPSSPNLRRRIAGTIDRLNDVHSWCISCIPRRFRYLVPKGSGDGGLVADFSVACPSRPRKGWDGYNYRAVRGLSVKFDFGDRSVPLSLASYFAEAAASSRQFLSALSDSRRMLGFRWKRYELFHEWQDIPEPIDNGSGFTIRGRVRYRTMNQFWPGPWPESPRWSARSVGLVRGDSHKTRR